MSLGECALSGWIPVTRDRATARAFVEQLFREYAAEIHAYLLRMVRDPELAADLTQEAFIKAYRACDTLEDAARARAWLYQIAGRTALDELRHRRIVRFVPWDGETRGTEASAEDLAMRDRLSGELERALARIPDRQRQALLLAELHGFSGMELATALDVSHAAARALLVRARESLRQALVVERAASAERESRGTRRPAAGQSDVPR
jgi:RNA polymerase sigma factor (sigma-70 family)